MIVWLLKFFAVVGTAVVVDVVVVVVVVVVAVYRVGADVFILEVFF